MTSKAMAAWTELNDRQQATLKVIFTLDQQVESTRKIDAANGYWDKRPASEWRQLDFAHGVLAVVPTMAVRSTKWRLMTHSLPAPEHQPGQKDRPT